MARKHRFSIVVLLGAAVVAGFFALSRSVQLGAASKPASAAQMSARARSLDRLEAQLRQLGGAAGGGSEGAEGRDPIRVAGCCTSARPLRPRRRPTATTTSTTASTAPRATTGRSERQAEMTDHVVRLYTASAAIIVFFVAWAGIAARPWVDAGARSAGRCSRAASAAPPARRRARPAHRRSAGGSRPRRPGDAGGRTAGGACSHGAHREPSTPHHHEELVMLRRRFRAMGTDCELFLRARPRPGRFARWPRPSGMCAASSASSRGSIPTQALGAQPEGQAAGRAGVARGRRARARRQGSDERPLRPDGARRARRRRLRPHVRRGGCGRTPAAIPGRRRLSAARA